MNTAIKDKAQGKLTLAYVLEQVQQDKIISPQQKAQLYAGMTKDTEMNTHPLMIVADQGWQSITKPPYPLSLEQWSRWPLWEQLHSQPALPANYQILRPGR